MTHRVRITLVVASCSLLALAIGLLLGRNHTSASRGGGPAPTARPATNRIRVDPGLAQRAGIRTSRAERAALTPRLELLGSVDFDADRVADVGGRISGRVTQLFVRPGDNVVRNQPLARIESAELGEALAKYQSARADSIAARQNAERERSLGEQRLTTARVLEQASALETSASAELEGAEQRLLAMGFTRADIRAAESGERHITLRSPISGRVITRQVVLGQTVEATATILRVADLASVWVLLDVFEKDLPAIEPGAVVEIQSDAFESRVFTGRVDHVDSTIDLRTRTARVRVEVRNETEALRPGQFVTARVRVAGGGRETLVLPREALLQIEGRPSVFVKLSDQEFEARQVDLGATDGDRIEVRRGLREGEEIVTAGAFALKSELQR